MESWNASKCQSCNIRGKMKVTVNDIEGSLLDSFQLLCKELKVGCQSGEAYFSIGRITVV